MKSFNRNKKYTQGIYTCLNRGKYTGSYPIIFRSSLELKVMRWFDINPNVISWKSESNIIPYQGPDGKLHRYFIDFMCEMRRKNGEIQKFLIEVKPEKQTLPPILTTRQSIKTKLYESYNWAVNNKKWEAAKEWCQKHNMRFLILTEKHLKG